MDLSSNSSSLARQTTRIRPWPRSASSSMSSRKVGSAHWTSSKTRTSSLSAASDSQNCRKIQAISGAGGGCPRRAPRARRRSSPSCACWALYSGQYVMPSPYERRAAPERSNVLRAPRSSAASRDLPTPGGPETTATLTEPESVARFSPAAARPAHASDRQEERPAGARTRVARRQARAAGMHAPAPCAP